MASGAWTGHAIRQAILLALQVILAIALCAIVLALAERHNHRFDLTPTQSFVLSDQAITIARKVGAPTQISGFYNSQEPGTRRQVEDLLEQFNTAAPQVTFRLYDLDRSPALAKKLNISSYNTGAVESGDRVIPLSTLDEAEITNALLKLSARAHRTLCFLTGHGEHSPQGATERRGYSEVAKALERESFDVRAIERLPPAGVPTDCTVVISPGPTTDLFPGEADQLVTYVEHGGRLFILVDPDASRSVVELLARFNVKAGTNVVVDERNRLYGMDSFMPRVPGFDQETFRNNLEVPGVFSIARTVDSLDEKRQDISVLVIAATSPESWARIGDDPIPKDANVRFRPTVDKNGPLPVAVIATVHAPSDTTGSNPGRVAVFGDSDFASNFYLNLMGNKDLFMSTVAVLAEDEDLVAVRRKGLMHGSISPISLTARQGRMIFWSAVILQPGVLLLLGMLITFRRQRRGGA